MSTSASQQVEIHDIPEAAAEPQVQYNVIIL